MTVLESERAASEPVMCRYTSRRTGCRVYLPSPYAACPSLLAQQQGMEWSANEPASGAGCVKRKSSPCEEEESGGASYVDIRQAVLNMSLVKLRMSPQQRRVEPSLRRSVLIFNTLKNIETELRGEGVATRPFYTAPPPQLLTPQPAEVDLDPRPDSLEAAAGGECLAAVAGRVGRAVEPESPSGGAATCCVPGGEASQQLVLPSVTSSSSSPSSVSLSETRTLLDSVFSATFPSPLDTDSRQSVTPAPHTLPTDQHPLPPPDPAAVVASLAPNTHQASTDFTDTELLHEFDLSWLDLDLLTPLTSLMCGNSGSNKLTSLTSDDLTHSLSPCGGGDVDMTSNIPTPSCNPKLDLLTEDLERVVGIPVGM